MKKQGPLLGDVLVAVPLDGVEDCLERIEWLKANWKDGDEPAMADAQAKLARAQEREQTL